MKELSSMLALSILFSPAAGVRLGAQETDKPLIVPIKVEIVISRYQGEKKISTAPYTLSVNTNLNKTSLRVGSELPIVATSFSAAGGENKEPRPLHSYQYRPLGTKIDCSALTLPDGRFRLDVTIEDSSVYPNERPPAGAAIVADVPAFRSFASTNSIILKDGQSMQYMVATDKVTGEVTRVDISLTVLK